MNQKRVLLTVILSVGALASSAYAHHSHPYFYDECKSVTIEGRIEKVEFKDPHTWIFLRLDDGAAYTVDWAPLSRLTNQGVIGPAKESLVFGARIVVTGNRMRTAAQIRERCTRPAAGDHGVGRSSRPGRDRLHRNCRRTVHHSSFAAGGTQDGSGVRRVA